MLELQIAPYSAKVEKDGRGKDRFRLSIGIPAFYLVYPIIKAMAPVRVARHHSAATKLEAAQIQLPVDVLSERKQLRANIDFTL